MKKLLMFVIALLLVVSVVGCTNPEAPLNHTYELESEHFSVKMKVKDGYIEYRKVCNLETDECNTDYDWDDEDMLTNADKTQTEIGLEMYLNVLEGFYTPDDETS